MNKIKKAILYISHFIGFNHKGLSQSLRRLKQNKIIRSELEKFRQQYDDESNKAFPLGREYFIYKDRFDTQSIQSMHYFIQDAFVAQRVFENNPKTHVDIGSRLDGFITHFSSFREIELFDIRPINYHIDNIKFIQADMMKLDPNLENYTDSISSLHALEHFGLGRYGDPLDINGHLKGFENIGKTLNKGGEIYFSVPIGKQRIEFNAHRVFGLDYLLNEMIKDQYEIDHLSYINDQNELFKNALINN